MAALCGKLGDLINLLCMPCASAADYGVSSHQCFRAFRYSLPRHMIDMIKEMGRVDRGHNCSRTIEYNWLTIFIVQDEKEELDSMVRIHFDFREIFVSWQ